jgi:hypothetical protein
MINFLILVILSFISTAIMSYISMATPIGPWIAPTLVIFSLMLIKIINKKLLSSHNQILQVTGSSVGGILATALGFSLPTLYFLDPILFKSWLQYPLFFSCIITFLSLSAGLFAFWVANIFEDKFIIQQNLNFPIGQMVYKMICAQNQFKKAKQLIVGFISTIFFCIFQEKLFGFKNIISKSITITKPISYYFLKIPEIRFDLFPTYWAIGFITGEIIAFPLLAGALSKVFIVDVINNQFFQHVTNTSFMLAFCSGLVLSGAIFGFFDMPKNLWNIIKNINSKTPSFKLNSWVLPIPTFKKENIKSFVNFLNQYQIIFLFIVLLINFLFLDFFNFSMMLQSYLMIFTFICTYQIVAIAGKIGLAQLGRFATFVMVPAMFIFNLDFIQLTIIATYVEICGGVATDILFGRKIGQLSEMSKTKLKQYQLLGIIITSLIVGFIFWLLISNLTLGSSELFAQRAQARALLINAVSFDRYVLIIGFIFGLILKKIKVNPMLTLGGLLMPFNISLGLIAGGLSSKLLKDKEKWEPFWSGVFASHSIWMIVQAIFKL